MLLVRAGEAQREPEINGQLQSNIEELRPEFEGAQVGRDVAHVEAPIDGTLNLGAALLAHFIDVGMLPEIDQCPREAAIAVEQRGRVRDRPQR